MANAIEEAGITWECEKKKGRPHCRPTPDAQEKIHDVMVKTFGETKAAQIREDFDKCDEENKGNPKGHGQCLRDSFSKDQVAEMANAIEEAGITWECEKKKERRSRGPECRPTPEARERIHAAIVKTFGEQEGAKIRHAFDKCAKDNAGNPKGHKKCLQQRFSPKDVEAMKNALEGARITWECEEKREEDIDWAFILNIAPLLQGTKTQVEKREDDIDWELIFSFAPALAEAIKEQ